MTLFNVRISFIVGTVLSTVGLASNLTNFQGANGLPLGPRYSLTAMIILICCLLAATISSSSNRAKSISVNKWFVAGFWPLGVLFLQAIALARTAITVDILTIASIYFLLLLLLLIGIYGIASQYLYKIGRHNYYWNYLALSIITLAMSSLLLRSIGHVGLTVDNLHQSVILSLLNIDVNRPSMPLFSGLNDAGTIFGAAICSGYILVMTANTYWRSFILFFLTLSAIGLLLWVDTRGSMLAVLITMLIVFPQRKIRAGLIFFIILCGVIFIFSNDLNQMTALSRDGVDISSSRLIIWMEAFREILKPKLIQIIGYGAWGQYVSGLSGGFYGLFSNDIYETVTMHNAFLQSFIDSGYLGLMFSIVCWIKLLRTAHKKFIKNRKIEANSLKLALLAYLFISGIFEAISGYSSAGTMFLYVGVLVGYSTDLAYDKRASRKMSCMNANHQAPHMIKNI